jgi:5-bromo-4-chloroindolyl phosphate hydrolysis protein
MYVYSVFLTIIADSASDWVDYMQTKHLSDVMNTNCFLSYNFIREEEPLTNGDVNFRVDYIAESKDKLDDYLNNYTEALRLDVVNRFAGKFIAKRKIYKIVQ